MHDSHLITFLSSLCVNVTESPTASVVAIMQMTASTGSSSALWLVFFQLQMGAKIDFKAANQGLGSMRPYTTNGSKETELILSDLMMSY